jgi:phosphatidylinositol alpha-1,6-mannosyltransferase
VSGPRRVLVPALHFHRRGGVEIYTYELACALRRLGWEPEMVACLQAGNEPREGFEHTGLAPDGHEQMLDHVERWPAALETFLSGRSPREELIFAAHPYTLPQVGPYARRHGIPMAVVFYGVDAWDLYDSLRIEIERGGTVVAISRYTADAIECQAHPASGPVLLLPPPIDGGRFRPGPPGELSPTVLLTVSRLSMHDGFKGHRTVIDSLAWIVEQLGREVEYWIAGEGPYGEVLLRHARARGAEGRVRLLGFVEDAALPDLYRRADLFVMPSELGRREDGTATGEGFGMVFTEAAACGTPSVGLAHAGAAEAIADGISGITVPDRESVGPAILRLLRDDDERRRLGRRGAEWALDQFGYRSFDARLREIIDHAVSR